MDGTAQFGWGPDWTPCNMEGLNSRGWKVTKSSDVSPLGPTTVRRLAMRTTHSGFSWYVTVLTLNKLPGLSDIIIKL